MTDALQMKLFTDAADHRLQGWFANALNTLGITETTGWPDSFGDALRQWNGVKVETKVSVISLFSGGGGLDIGFHDAGFKIVECNEIEPNFAATLRRNASAGCRLEGVHIACQDIHQYQPCVKQIDFIIGGPPCQTFSAAGARSAGVNGTDDDRGNLFLQYARIIDQLRPQGFLFENVYRIVGAQSGRPWKQIQAAFQDIGYRLYWRILDAADYGVPQFRERLIIVGLKTGDFRFPFPSHGPDSPDCHRYYNARQAVRNIDTSHCRPGIGGRHGYLLDEIPPGLNYSYYTERMGHPKPIFGWRSKFSDYLYKADPDSPVRTIKAQGGQYTGPFSWENRPFTTEELKRLQTFPDNFVIEGNRQTVIHQIGNSVPPQLARILALSILDQVFGATIPFTISYMPESYHLGFRKRKGELTAVYAQKAADAISKNNSLPLNHYTDVNGVEFFSLSSDLRVLPDLTKETSDYTAEFSLTKHSWTIWLSDAYSSSSSVNYEIHITPPSQKELTKTNTSAPATLVSRSHDPKSLLALWKIYELLVQRHLYKDDLVQLFGYYQYKLAYSITMTIYNDTLLSAPFWRAVHSVTTGFRVGVITLISELSDLYNLSDEDLLFSLRQMKDIGYEIRNHKTNKQIRSGMILIPYSFPTLNERSLQRHTRL